VTERQKAKLAAVRKKNGQRANAERKARGQKDITFYKGKYRRY